MKRIYFLLTAIMLCCFSLRVMAEAVSPEQAKQLASGFITAKMSRHYSQSSPVHRVASKLSNMETAVVFDATDMVGQPYLYAVSQQEGGYVLVSGDDRFRTVLGYSETGIYDEQTMPENMRAWLQQYIDEMQYLESNGYMPSEVSEDSTSKPAINPLIETRWNQSEPYNNLCPMDNGKRSVTGCVATAMAQVINYHMQHYNAPTEIIADIPAYITNSRDLEVDSISAGTLLPNRTLLRNIYDENATDAEKEAVAQLMLYCGTAVHMDYRSSSSSGNSHNVAPALIKYFGFDATTKSADREKYRYADWMNLIYAELAASRPVYYSGSSSGGGHAFVVDGYDGDGLFHVNWGWGGSSDNYFALAVLNPDDDGQIGASVSSDGYAGGQMAILGCQITGQTVEPTPYCMDMKFVSVEDERIYFSAFNRTGDTHSFDFGIAILEEDGSLNADYRSYDSLLNNYGWSKTYRPIPMDVDLVNTTKKIVLVSREKGTRKWCVADELDNYIIAEYDADGIPTLTMHPIIQLEGKGIIIPSSKFVDESQNIVLTAKNIGDEFYNQMFLFASKTAEKGLFETKRSVTILEDATEKICFEWVPDTVGTYNIWIALDSEGKNVIDSTVVLIKEDPARVGKTLMIRSVSFNGQDELSWKVDAETGLREVTVYADSLYGRVTIQNMTDEDISCPWLQVLFDRWNGVEYEADTYSRGWSLNPYPANKSYRLNIKRSDLTSGNTYRIRVVNTDDDDNETVFDNHYIVHLLHERPNDPGDGTDDVVVEQTQCVATKVLRDGQIYILRGDKIYTMTGMVIH